MRFHRDPHPDHLILKFLDLDTPLPAPYADQYRYRLASHEDVASALKFGEGRTDLLVHCHAGISRSTAIMLGILAARTSFPEALQTVLELSPNALPNRHIIGLLDDLLGRNGELKQFMDDWYESEKSRIALRQDCRQAHLWEFGINDVFEDRYVFSNFLGYNGVMFIDKELLGMKPVVRTDLLSSSKIARASYILFMSPSLDNLNFPTNLWIYKCRTYPNTLLKLLSRYFPSANMSSEKLVFSDMTLAGKSIWLSKQDYALLLYILKDKIVTKDIYFSYWKQNR